jgi:hypothetical protein
MIPWTGEKWTQYRYYHLYSLKELKEYSELSGLKISTLEYLDKEWKSTKNREDANNSLLVAKKTIYKK